jgi:inorganic pyrophosphatase
MVHEGSDGKHSTVPMLFGLHAVMLGRQGSGKGTQGVQLARLLVVPHVSVGDVLREAVRSESPAGRRAQETMERGGLVDDDLVVSLVAERLAGADVRSGGFVLDGFPRTVEQAEALAGMLADATLDRAVVIDVPLEVARARLLARRVCAGCGRIYSVAQASGLETWTCGACGGLVRRRADDTDEAVTRRLTLYDEQTRPLLDWFDRHDQLLVVDGVGTSEEVFTRLLAGLWPRIPTDRIAQLAGVSEPVPTEPAASPADEDLSALAVEVVIEVPRGSRNKYEFDHERHVLHLDRRLFSATVYPADYGFIPETLAEDGDPLDALVLLEEPVFPGCWVRARPVGIFWMEDEKGPDAKIICVPLGDPRWDQVRDLDDMAAHLRSEIHHFFDVYKALEPGKSTSTTGFEGREAALGEIAASRARLAHQQQAGAAASEEVLLEAAPAVGGLLVDIAARAGPSSRYWRLPRVLRVGRSVPERATSHSAHRRHHEPCCTAAVAIHSSGSDVWGGPYALATTCIGGGQGIAAIFEHTNPPGPAARRGAGSGAAFRPAGCRRPGWPGLRARGAARCPGRGKTGRGPRESPRSRSRRCRSRRGRRSGCAGGPRARQRGPCHGRR